LLDGHGITFRRRHGEKLSGDYDRQGSVVSRRVVLASVALAVNPTQRRGAEHRKA